MKFWHYLRSNQSSVISSWLVLTFVSPHLEEQPFWGTNLLLDTIQNFWISKKTKELAITTTPPPLIHSTYLKFLCICMKQDKNGTHRKSPTMVKSYLENTDFCSRYQNMLFHTYVLLADVCGCCCFGQDSGFYILLIQFIRSKT